eukprot:CFRG3214T1
MSQLKASTTTIRFQSLAEIFKTNLDVLGTVDTPITLNVADKLHPIHHERSKAVPPGFCGDEGSVAGFYPVGEGKEYFYWAFPSLNDPLNDPVILWLTGGPGCSGMVALFLELGPCTISKDGKTTVSNPYAWNRNATVIFLDQPAGVGFSTGPETSYGEAQIGKQMQTFVEDFLQVNSYLRKNKFFVFGESYGGHYIPAVGASIHQYNKLGKGRYINLAGIAIGNGLTDGVYQVPEYLDYVANNPLDKLLCSKDDYEYMKLMAPECERQIDLCQRSENKDICEKSCDFCNELFLAPIIKTGINHYDIRKKCAGPMCYDMSMIDTFLNNADNQAILGVSKKWETCNMVVHQHFVHEWMRSFSGNVTYLLQDDIPVLLYAGDMDFSVNYMGVKAFAKSINWNGKQDFNNAPDVPWVHGNELAGFIRKAGPLSFIQVHNAGHMVPLDVPEAALEMVNTFMFQENV